MQLLRIADVPITDQDRVYRYSRIRALSVLMVLSLLAMASLAFGWLNNTWLAYYIPAVTFLFLVDIPKTDHCALSTE